MQPTQEYEDLIREASKAFKCPEESIRNTRCRQNGSGMIRGCIGSLLYNEMGCEDVYALMDVMKVHRATASRIVNEHPSRMDHWKQYRDSYNYLKGKFIKREIL